MSNAVCQRRPLDQFKDQGSGIPALLDTVNRRDVGMVQAGEDLGFALETGQPVRVGGEGVGQNLERNLAAKLRVCGLIDLSHATLAN